MVVTVATGIALVGAATALYGTYSSYKGQRKAAKAQAQQGNLKRRSERRAMIRQGIIRNAETAAIANQYGAGTGSGFAGGQSSRGSQISSQFGYSTQQGGLSNIASSGFRQAQFGQALTSLGTTAMSLSSLAEKKTDPGGGGARPDGFAKWGGWNGGEI